MAPNVATRVVFKNILFATDFSEVSQRALLHALAIARRYHAKFSVVHVAHFRHLLLQALQRFSLNSRAS